MLFSLPTLALALTVTAAAAAPHSQQEEERRRRVASSSEILDGDFYDSWSRKGHNFRAATTARAAEQCRCDTSLIEMPQASKPLPPVSAGFTLYHIAIGRGTQNYTCDLSNTTAVPAAAGAVATLINATCLTATSPSLAWSLAGWAYQDQKVKEKVYAKKNVNVLPINDFLKISGHHYFTDLTTAYFNLDTQGQGDDTWQADYSQGAFRKISATDAPRDAKEGSVPWLKLVSKQTTTTNDTDTTNGTEDTDTTNDTECAFQEVYRINTVGGAAPQTCEGMAATFEVEYAAEYWFYAKGPTAVDY